MKNISDNKIMDLLYKLQNGKNISRSEYILLLSGLSENQKTMLQEAARNTTDRVFGRKVFVRGLIEISNNCRNNCNYCGIRNSNRNIRRYRLTVDEILECCSIGANLGFSTFVLQGGEDPHQDDRWVTGLIRKIKHCFPEHAVTLSLGEKSAEAYKSFRDAGADRYLLRHETANAGHYSYLHPAGMSLGNRINCLKVLKSLGFQTGAGMMIGSPGQTTECLADDLMLLEEIEPEMIGIGPFIPAANTPFSGQPAGSVNTTLLMLSILRLRFPKALLPATTALASISTSGRINGLMAGANVIMPNLSPQNARDKYTIYDNKLNTGSEAAEQLDKIEKELDNYGFSIDRSRGDYPGLDN